MGSAKEPADVPATENFIRLAFSNENRLAIYTEFCTDTDNGEYSTQ
jgi:hypothetical protein